MVAQMWDRTKQKYWVSRANNTIYRSHDNSKVFGLPASLDIYDTAKLKEVCFAEDDVELLMLLGEFSGGCTED
jgi:hypothetical protein